MSAPRLLHSGLFLKNPLELCGLTTKRLLRASIVQGRPHRSSVEPRRQSDRELGCRSRPGESLRRFHALRHRLGLFVALQIRSHRSMWRRRGCIHNRSGRGRRVDPNGSDDRPYLLHAPLARRRRSFTFGSLCRQAHSIENWSVWSVWSVVLADRSCLP